jgi:hypothetical protein
VTVTRFQTPPSRLAHDHLYVRHSLPTLYFAIPQERKVIDLSDSEKNLNTRKCSCDEEGTHKGRSQDDKSVKKLSEREENGWSSWEDVVLEGEGEVRSFLEPHSSAAK